MTTTAVRSANTLSVAVLVVCLTSCGSDNQDSTKSTGKSQSQSAAGHAARGDAGSTSNSAGASGSSTTGASGGTGSGTAGRTAGSGGASAANGGKGGTPAAGSDGGKAGASGDAAGANAGASDGDTGAGDQPDASVEPADVDVAGLAASLAAAICDALKSCVGPTKLAMLTGREDCVARYSASIDQDEFGTLAESIKAGAIELDESKLATCYDDTRAQGCAVVADRLPPSCQEAIAAQRKVGESCSLDADCAGDAFCPVDTACPRSCVATHAAGAACTRDAECERGAICNAGTCALPATIGDDCAGNTGGVCALGESCVGSTDVVPGTCDTNANVQSAELDATCTPGGTLCKEGLSCAYDGSTFQCVASVGSGEACTLALPSQCPVETYCSAADLGQSGTCLALPTDGKACVLNNACAGGHVCVTQSGKATCRKLGNLGDACLADGLCRSGACLNGTCAIRMRCE